MTKTTFNTDVLIAGSGGTGLAAAYAAAEKGFKVIVIEKLDKIGGNTRISSGFFAIGSKEQKNAGLNLSKKEAIARLTNYNHYLANGPLVSHIVNNSANTLEWLENIGMEIKLNPTKNTTQFAHRGDDYKGGSYHMYQHKDKSYQRIQKNLEKVGVTFKFNTTLTSLLTEDSKVIGATAIDGNGKDLTINAISTVIATGGYGANKEMVTQKMCTNNLRPLGVPNMGEGFKAMLKSGATDLDSTALIHAAQLAKSTVTQATSDSHLAGFSHTALTQLLLTPQLWVNLNGKRFANEDTVYDTVEWANTGWAAGGKYYFVVDQTTLNIFTKGKNSLEVSQAGPGADTESGNFTELAQHAVEAKTAFKGSTLEELAKNAGMKPKIFTATIDKYNMAVKTKKDNEFSKSSKSLVFPIKDGPFYAFICQVAYLGTIGGVRVDENLKVLDTDFNPIPGLFTGGANAGGYYEGHSYPAYEGLASGFSWTSGRIAGNSAAEYAAQHTK